MTTAQLLKTLASVFYVFLYRQCYSTGLYTIYAMETMNSVLSGFFEGLSGSFSGTARHLGIWVRLHLRSVWDRMHRTKLRLQRVFSAVSASFLQLRHGSLSGFFRLQLTALQALLSFLWPLLLTVINYALPVVALVLCLRVVGDISSIQYGLSLNIAGKEVGVIESESVYDAAITKVHERMEGLPALPMETLSTQFRLVPAPREGALLDEYTLSDLIISALGQDLQSAYGLYVGGSFQGATTDRHALLSLLSGMQDQYLSGAPNETASFVQPITVRAGLYPEQNLRTVTEISDTIDRDVSAEFRYTVEKGDAPSIIAAQFDMTVAELEALNPGVTKSLLIGDELLIAGAQPFLSVQVQRVEEYEQELDYPTEKIEDDSLYKGETEVEQEGEVGIELVRASVTYLDNVESQREILSRKTITEPVPEQILVGTKARPTPSYSGSALPSSGAVSSARTPSSSGSGTVPGGFIQPVVSGNVYVSNSFYGNRYYRYAHGALDFASAYGTPIYASAAGTVTYSAYTVWGYGRHIIIDHGNGVQTMYAHNSQNVVSVGQTVTQGQIIGYVGSTGNSTGNHCHFEIRINGQKKDPAAYLG